MQASHEKLGYQKTRNLWGFEIECERSESASYNVFILILAQTMKNDDQVKFQIYERK